MLDFYLCEHNDYSNCCYCFFRDYLYALPDVFLSHSLSSWFKCAIVCYFKNLYDRRCEQTIRFSFMSQKRKSIQFSLNHRHQIKSGNNEKRFGMQRGQRQ